MPLNLLVRPQQVVIPVLVRGVRITRLLVDPGVNVIELVTGRERLTIHVQVYGDVLRIDTTAYPPSLLVVRLSV